MLEVIQAAESVFNRKIYYKFANRRPGDSFALVTSRDKAKEILDWEPVKGLPQILIDAQNEFKSNN